MNRCDFKQTAVLLGGQPKRIEAAPAAPAGLGAAAANGEAPQPKRSKRRKTVKKTLVSIMFLTFVVGTGGCASRTPAWDDRFGDAVRAARAQQTLNPQAGRDGDPVAGLDGLAAHEAIERYKDATKTPPPVTNVINIGGFAK